MESKVYTGKRGVQIAVQRLACASNPVSSCKRVSQPQITKDRFSHVMAFQWSSDRRWQSTGKWFYIDCHYHNLRMPSYIGSELTRKGVCEQAEHVMSPQGIRRMMKTRTNRPMQKYRCSYKAFKWSKHSQKRKLWVFLQYEGREMNYSDSWEFCVPVVHISYLEVAISFQINECTRTSHLQDWMYVHALSCLLLCWIFEGS